VKLAASSYSFYRFGEGPETPQPALASLFERCSDLGLEGIELLGVQFASRERDYLNQLKKLSLAHAVPICSVSLHHNFVRPDAEARRAEVRLVTDWLQTAYHLGAPTVRVFGGRWQTARSFAEFMAAGGVEPPIEGCTDEQAYRWTIECFKECCAVAGERGITLALENHWGLTATAAGVRRILEGVDSPWMGVALDTGNFLSDAMAQIAELAPWAVIVHAKTYAGGGLYYTPQIDYPAVIRTLRRAGFDGYLSIEFEGRAHPDVGVPEAIATLRAALRESR
jgi:L-ribulose-5-phosphate 3-epimerase